MVADVLRLGTDFDGIHDPPAGFEDYAALPKLVEELIKRGHSDADIQKILGENFLAFFARVEAIDGLLKTQSFFGAASFAPTARPRP